MLIAINYLYIYIYKIVAVIKLQNSEILNKNNVDKDIKLWLDSAHQCKNKCIIKKQCIIYNQVSLCHAQLKCKLVNYYYINCYTVHALQPTIFYSF